MRYLHTYDDYDEYIAHYNGEDCNWDETDEGDFRYHFNKENC